MDNETNNTKSTTTKKRTRKRAQWRQRADAYAKEVGLEPLEFLEIASEHAIKTGAVKTVLEERNKERLALVDAAQKKFGFAEASEGN